ncbi:MAG: transporter substrate-binding protein [Nitrospiraceae bacterium]
MEAAYFGACLEAGRRKSRQYRGGCGPQGGLRPEVLAPGGEIMMDEANQHTHKPVLIGEILKDGQLKVVWRSKGLVKPEPWSEYTNPEKGCDWVNHQGTYKKV